jgi:hypothetical protein
MPLSPTPPKGEHRHAGLRRHVVEAHPPELVLLRVQLLGGGDTLVNR